MASHARDVDVRVQRRRERALIEAAELGEIHLHVSTLAGDVLALGAHHLDPSRLAIASDPGADHARGAPAHVRIWRRHTGGRALACGDGFLILTLGLPHRAALVGEQADDLRPEQVMNRCVRGLLRAFRELGIDLVYPGLDLVTLERRAVASTSFFEASSRATLFQAIIASARSFAETPRLLDAIDPRGNVPATILGAGAISIAEHLAAASVDTLPDALEEPESFGELVAAGYAQTFGLEVLELDPAVTATMLGDEGLAAPREGTTTPPSPAAMARDGAAGWHEATVAGRLGPVTAWVRPQRGRIIEVVLSGDFIAPEWLASELDRALADLPAEHAAITEAVDRVMEEPARGYLLGLTTGELAALITRAACA